MVIENVDVVLHFKYIMCINNVSFYIIGPNPGADYWRTMGGAVVDVGLPGVKAPDGGWGWAVLVGSFVITGFSYAFPKAVSVFFKELIQEFGVGYSDTAWISSILLAMLYGTGTGPAGDSGGRRL